MLAPVEDQGGQPALIPALTLAAVAAPPAPRAQAPVQEIAPPPPDAPRPTIELGQTRDEVIAGFGQPLKMVQLGAKTIFYYKDMKVTLNNGKVSNVG
jgi:hypothetical protein